MRIQPTNISGLLTVLPEPLEDDRGLFAVVSDNQLPKSGSWYQTNVSLNTLRGTLRGLHIQSDPFAQAKLVRCTRGAIQDVAVDFRPESPTYKQWFASSSTNCTG